MMDEYSLRRRLADRERGLRRVRSLTAVAGAGMVAVATVFAVTFAGSAVADSAPAADQATADVPAAPVGADAGNGVPGSGPAPVTRIASPRTGTASDRAGLTPPSSTPTRTRATSRHHSSSSSTHARTAGS